MKNVLILLLSFFVFAACQSTPKEIPSEQKFAQSLHGVAQAGYKSVQCQLHPKAFDQVDSGTEQHFAKQQYGRSWQPNEIKEIKNYKWTLSIDEQESEVTGRSAAEASDSDNARKFTLD